MLYYVGKSVHLTALEAVTGLSRDDVRNLMLPVIAICHFSGTASYQSFHAPTHICF